MSKSENATSESTVKSMPVRDFIYIDVQRLHSLSAQLFQGLSERVKREVRNESSSQDAQGKLIGNSRAETGTVEASRHEESGILHDFQYTKLEKAIQKSLADCNFDEATFDPQKRLENGQFIRVTGEVQINDYQRLREIFLNFIELDVSFKYVALSEKKQELRRALSNEQNKNLTKQLEKELNDLSMEKIRENSIRKGITLEPEYMESFARFIQIFNPDGFEILVSPSENKSVKYRGVFDRKWLRQDPSILRAMYQSQPSGHWTMVGQVTGISKMRMKDKDNDSSSPSELAVDANNDGNMGNTLRKLIVASSELERLFYGHDPSVCEVVVAPLAVYFERNIDVLE